MRTHASVPIAEHIDGYHYRIYFSARDENNRSSTAYVVIDIRQPGQILDISSFPVLQPGAPGEFDDSGAMATWIAEKDGKKYLYYIGWNLGVTVPFRNSIGLAVSSGKSAGFQRHGPGPIVDRTRTEPHFCASCCVIPDADIWRMWYLSCVGWFVQNGKLEHRYHLKYAESSDGVEWRRNGDIAIDFQTDNEYAISRPSVMRDGSLWKMWYSFRGTSYRIGYAESEDGRNWNRQDDKAGIDISADGWDSEMIEYPFVFDHDGSRYMLYNGNQFGKTGFGLAIQE